MMEHIYIIITSVQKLVISKYMCNSLWPGGVTIKNTARSIGIYRPHVFHVRSGSNQYYSPEYCRERLSPPSAGMRI